jgi:hypothetical protein
MDASKLMLSKYTCFAMQEQIPNPHHETLLSATAVKLDAISFVLPATTHHKSFQNEN